MSMSFVQPERGLGLRPARLEHFFEASCDRSPMSVAVLDGNLALTYAELERRSNQIAHRLRAHGVGAGSRVGLLLERSWLVYAALLGVLKSGAAFVPIDPGAPADRVAFIAENAALQLLLSSTELAATTADLPAPVWHLDALAEDLAATPAHRPEPAATDPDDDPLCYVIYTSGSSGRPKGVAVTQSSICNFISVVPAIYDVRPTDRVYQGMTISFDFSIEEIWPTFAVGATLVVGPTDSRRLGAELADFLDETGVTVFYCVPTLLATVPRDLPRIRNLLVGGEACPAGLVERWSRPGRRMLNTYGPTEATVTATWGELVPGRAVTIGRPLPTYTVVLLDEDLRPVPDGEVGEICIGGPGVAQGYVGLPEKTADRFVVHPLAPSSPDGSPGRLYRTGDLGRVDPNGEIVYLGRADSEVKIRGHRVDLEEIENILLEDPAVESAVAALVEVGGTDSLASYVVLRVPVPEGEAEQEILDRLHEQMRRRLPGYMVPAHLDALESLPTMPSGKVDRKRLPAPTGRRTRVGDGPVAGPGTDLEHTIRDTWAEAVGIEPAALSVEADFFTDLGGHSLLAANVVSALRERGVGNVALRDLYSNPTVRSLAAALDPEAAAAGTAPPTAAPRETPLRHSGRRIAAAGTLQAAFLYALLFVVSLPIAIVYTANDGAVSAAVLVELGLAIITAFLLTRWVLMPFFVRMLAAGIRPGRYPLWSAVYVRLWAMDVLLALAPVGVLSGSPLMPGYLRMLGARVGADCHIATGSVSLPTMLALGPGSCIGYGAEVQPWVVEDGWVRVGPIQVGADAFVGANAVLEPDTRIGEGAVIANHSTVERGQVVGDGERWAGSPSARVERLDPLVEQLATAPPVPGWTRRLRRRVVAGLLLLELLPLLMFVPGVAMVWWALLTWGVTAGFVAALLVGPVFVLTVCLLVVTCRRLVLPRTPVGVHPLASGLGIRKWMVDKLLEQSLTHTNSLYATLYTVLWLRALGAKVGRGAEVSTAAHLDPDLLDLREDSFVADMAAVGCATFYNGRMALHRTTVGRRAFVGNASMVPAGTRLGDDSLVGVHTVPPSQEVPEKTSWLGSPAMYLPKRQDSGAFDESLTFRPTRRQRAERLAIEFFRVSLPASLLAAAFYLYLLAISQLADGAGLLVVATMTPLFAIAASLLVVLTVATIKWCVVGTYRPRVEPLWSRFVRRTEFVTGLYEAAAVPALLALVVGTPFLAPLLRLFGTNIGRRTWIGTTYLTEFDLVTIDDEATVGRGVSLQTHLFEDRVMKMSTVRIGPGATIGDRAIVLYDSVVGPRVGLGPLTLVMKGEQLPAGTRWRGIPAEGAA